MAAAVINAQGKIDAAQGSLTDCVLVGGTSTPCGSGGGGGSTLWPNFAAETPGATGDVMVWTLVHTPDPAPLLQLYLNGVAMTQGVDYTLSGSTITFVSAYSTLFNSNSSSYVGWTAPVLAAYYQFGVQASGSVSFLNAVTSMEMLYTLSASGSGSTYTGCPMNTVAQLTQGMVVNWVPDVNGAGGSTTFNFCAQGGPPLKEADGSTNPSGTDIVAGKLYAIYYDGAVWRLPAISGTVGCSGMPALTGDVTSSAGSCATTEANTTVTPGSYTAANITVDAKGRVTAAANGSASSSQTIWKSFPMAGILNGSYFGLAPQTNASVALGVATGAGPLSIGDTVPVILLSTSSPQYVAVTWRAASTWSAAAGTVDVSWTVINRDGAPGGGSSWNWSVYVGCAAANSTFTYGTASTLNATPTSTAGVFTSYAVTAANLPGTCAAGLPVKVWVVRTADTGSTTVNAAMVSIDVAIRGN